MSCEQYLNLIEDLAEGEPDERIAGRVESHVFTCAKCRVQWGAVKREKDVYARYLYDIEPPHDLRANFQTRLAEQKMKTSRFAETLPKVSVRKTGIFDFRRFSPLLAGASLMIVFGIGFGWLKLASDETNKNIHVAKTDTDDLPLPSAFDETVKVGTAESPSVIGGGQKNAAPPNDQLSGRRKFSKAGGIPVAAPQPLLAKAGKIERKTVSADARGTQAEVESRLSDESRRHALQTKNLENEIAGQIERVELLLRSFRNAQANETTEIFDIEYEKGQARRLLEKNARLRESAESYGIFYAEELLSRVEPYLLDIANLTDHPTPDEVLDIRERVKNQSIIASLQTY